MLIAFGGLASAGFCAAACGDGEEERAVHDEETAHVEGQVEMSAERLAAITLLTAPVESRRLAARLETTGEVGYDEDRIAHVAPRIPGRVRSAPVSLGEEVRRGQLLAVLDSVELGQAKAAFLSARTHEELARTSHERARRLHEEGITPEQDLLEHRAELQEAASAREGAEGTLRLYGLSAAEVAELTLGDPGTSSLPIRAPIAGRVVAKHATLGELATPETALFTVGDLDHVWIWIDVFERDLAGVHPGDGAEVRVESFPGRAFTGEVTYLSPEVDSETRTVRARIDVANPERALRPGMFASVRLADPHSEAAAPSLVVPESAIVRRAGETLVFVPLGDPEGGERGDGASGGAASGGVRRFEARLVELGLRADGVVEVVTGLAAGERVVTEGAFFLESELARAELGGGHSH